MCNVNKGIGGGKPKIKEKFKGKENKIKLL